LGGSVREREARRYEVVHVPAIIRNRDRLIGTGEAVLTRYERICFEKELISVPASQWLLSSLRGYPLPRCHNRHHTRKVQRAAEEGAVLIDTATREMSPGRWYT